MTSHELNEAGYVIPLYGLYTHTFVVDGKSYEIPHGAVRLVEVQGWPCAKTEEVRAYVAA